MTVVVVTGTSTDVGKTVVTAALAVALEHIGLTVAVCKPAQTGVSPTGAGDLDAVARLSDPDRRRHHVECVRYPDPLAPNVAARRAGLLPLRMSDAVDAITAAASSADVVLVEGAGGVAVRLDDDGLTVLDLARAVGASVVVVTESGLGALNHAALTVDAVRRTGAFCPGLVIGSWPSVAGLADITNLAELPAVTGVPILGRIPEGAGALPSERFVSAAPDWFDVDFLHHPDSHKELP